MSLLERCPHFRGCYVQASMELGPENVSPLERCPPTGLNGGNYSEDKGIHSLLPSSLSAPMAAARCPTQGS